MSTFQKPNKNIDNASGQVVREDMEDTLKAVAAHNYGPLSTGGELLPTEFIAENSGTPKKLFMRATSGGTLAQQGVTGSATLIEVGNLDEPNLGLLKRAGDTLTGSLQFINGVHGTPSINFGDTTTGLFKSAPNAIGFSTAGVERVTIANSGLDMLGLPVRFRDSDGTPNFVSVQAPSSLSGDLTLKLPNAVVNGGFMQTDGNGQLSFQTINGVPTGAIFALPDTQAGGNDGYELDGIPTGYKHCNGDAISRSTFSALFAVIGTTYGAGDGSSTFNLPDLRGQFIRGVNTTNSGDDPNRAIGSSQTDDNKSHNHSASTSISDSGHYHHSFKLGNSGEQRTNSNLTSSTFPASGTGAGHLNEAYNIVRKTSQPNVGRTSTKNSGISASTSIGNRGSESRPVNIAMMYIIKF